MMSDILQQVMNVTPAEGVLLIWVAAILVQFLIFRHNVNQALAKQNGPHFPGLSAALADIPARAALRAKQRDS